MQFAEADLLMRRSRYSESMALFSDVIKNYPDALLIDDATMKVGELCLHLHRPEEAIKTFRFIADSINISILKDRSIFRIAETYQNVLGRKEPAKAAYEELITRFPNSMYVEECRKRIRILRGDAI
jgi:TolA-binding protein